MTAHEVDARADIYSLGCTLYALLTGRPPFEGRASRQPRGQDDGAPGKGADARPDVRADVPAKLATLLQRMMAKKPENRLATAAEVAEALRPFCAGADLPALLARARPRRRRKEHRSRTHGLLAAPLVIAMPVQTAGQRRRSAWTVVAAAAALFIVVALGIIIRIRHKDGRETVVHVPDDAQIIIEQDDSSTAAAAPKARSGRRAERRSPATLPAAAGRARRPTGRTPQHSRADDAACAAAGRAELDARDSRTPRPDQQRGLQSGWTDRGHGRRRQHRALVGFRKCETPACSAWAQRHRLESGLVPRRQTARLGQRGRDRSRVGSGDRSDAARAQGSRRRRPRCGVVTR